ncbi:CHAT domain-containing protein [Nonomuraea sp. B10E15]|uniref:CHAT domain-containing protein n=1 Tax=Nonomuraea sp. B10E15 TaxID=3153560 RepID=UPI00325E6526
MRTSAESLPPELRTALCVLLTAAAEAGSRGGSDGLLDEAVAHGRAALASSRGPGRAAALRALAYALTVVAHARGEHFWLEEAVALGDALIELLPPPARMAAHGEQAQRLLALHSFTGDEEPLSQADTHMAALRRAAPHDARVRLMEAELQATRYRCGRRLDACAQAIRLAHDALQVAEGMVRVRALHLLGELHMLRGTEGHHADALRTAVDFLKEAIACVPEHQPAPGELLRGFSVALRALARAEQDPQLLRKAVEAAQGGLAATAGAPPGARSGCHVAHLEALFQMLEHTDDELILAEATRAAQAMLQDAPSTGPLYAAAQHYYSRVFYARYVVERDPGLIDPCVKAAEESVAHAASDPYEKGQALAWLAQVLRLRVDTTNRADVLRGVVDAGRRALALAPAEDTPAAREIRTQLLPGLLCHALASYAKVAASADDRKAARAEALRLARQTYEALSPEHQGYADHACLLSHLLLHDAPHHEIVDILISGAEASGSPPAARLECRRLQAYAHFRIGEHRLALDAIRAAVDLLPATAPRAAPLDARARRLENHFGLATEAVLLATTAGRVGEAVELLEQTRGVILGDLLGLRTPTRLADEFAQVLDTLTEQPPWGSGHGTRLKAVESRREAAARFEQLIAEAKDDDDEGNPFRPPSLNRLQERLGGTTVIVSCVGDDADGSSHGQAILLGRTGEPTTVPLLDLSSGDVARWARFLAGDGQEDDEKTIELLAWLWETIAEPIVAQCEVERIWWSPVGLLASMPLHAAGQHRKHGDNLLDRMVSSYMPSLRSLAPARSRSGAAAKLLVVTPQDDDEDRLPAMRDEAEAIIQLVGNAHRAGLERPLHEELPRYGAVHVAAHATAHLGLPASSGIRLGGSQKLSLRDVTRLRGMEAARFAYLSACSTAKVRTGLADEAIHLSAAFQVAGYAQVVGTLWPVADTIAAEIAMDFYRSCSDARGLRPDRAAFALHDAVRRARKCYRQAPRAWASHVHLGI